MTASDFHKLIDFLLRQQFFVDSLHKNLQEMGVKTNDKTGFYSAILVAHMFAPTDREIPLEYYIENAKISVGQKDILKLWIKYSFFSMFEVLNAGKVLTVQDIVSDKIYSLNPFVYSAGKIERGNLLVARIAPQDKSEKSWLALAGNVLSYPREARKILKTELKKDPSILLGHSTDTLADELSLIKYTYI